ncbi:hemicentin-2 [Parambassis ranga]|uniref:Hemicentin-2 n=1 Tax=Parambassis ranga TaxID=210632 RepID=A0A6P7IXA6_9TELE|nr:hemicentin-2-like [Parambassis ranga]
MTQRVLILQLFVSLLLGATGVDSSCPIELSPPRVVVKFGDPVSVNCSTSERHEGLGWEAPIGGTGAEPVDHLVWTVDKLTDWNISPKCFLNPIDQDQCSTVLEVVVYRFPDTIGISSNSDVEGVMTEGKEYIFTCILPSVAPVKNLSIVFYKNNTIEHRDTFNFLNKQPTGLSAQYVFTPRRSDNALFRCEAHMDLGPEVPPLSISSEEYELAVHFGPEIQCTTIELQEEETLEGKCSVAGNPPPVLTWHKDGQPIDPFMPLSRDTAGMYKLQAQGNSDIEKDIRVLVLYEPVLACPSTYTALEDTTHNLTCVVKGYPQPVVIWFKDGEEVELPERLTRSDTGQYLITASNNLSSINVTVDITVLYPPSEIVELEDSEVHVGSPVWLKCSSMGNPRPEYNWTYFQTDNVLEENEDGVSRLHIENTTGINTGSYTCHAWNHMGNVTKTVRVTVKGTEPECPITITPSTMVMQHQSGRQIATCMATSSSSSNLQEIYWTSTKGTIADNTTWWPDSHKDWDARPVCKATFKGIGQCHKTLNFILYKTPDSVSIYRLDNYSSVEEDKELQLQCDIINVAPAQALTVEWYLGNESINTVSVRKIVCGEHNNADCSSSRSPVNVSSTVNITLNRNHSEAEISCVARLNLGSDELEPPLLKSNVLNITVFYKPSINTTKLPETVPVFTGYTVNLICEADGHPAPVIQWYSSSKGSIVGEGRLIVSEEGMYNCTATNEVGSTSHVVQVILEVDYLPLIAGFVAVAVVAISIIFLCIYSVYYKNTKMRRYSLKNPKLSAHNGNVAHNGWDTQFPMSKLPYVYSGKPVSASCPLRLNPTIAEVKFGDTLSANCSSLSDQTDGMGWESSHGGVDLQDKVTSVLLHIAKVNVWTIESTCFINLNDGSQCTQKLPITIYKMPDSVSISHPSEMDPMVEGERYLMQCNIVNVAPVSRVFVYWYKNDKQIHSEVFNASKPSPENKTSIFSLTAHRDDNGAKIWCEAKLGLQTVRENISKKSSELQVTVLYSPAFTKAENETVELPSNDEMTLNCTASGNPKPTYSWRLPNPVQKTIKDEIVNESLLTPSFQLPGIYACTASNSQGTSTKYFTVVPANRDRTTFAAIIGGFVSLGVVIAIAGLVLVKPDGTFSVNKGGYLSGQPTSSGVVSWEGTMFCSTIVPGTVAKVFQVGIFFLLRLNRRLSVGNNMGNKFVRWILLFCMICSVSGEGCSLILKPSRVVVGFGESVSVSCEATRPVRVLGWESAISASHTQEDRSVQWKVDSLIDWIEEPICYGVFFTAPRQCEEKLNLVLYKTPDSVSIRQANHTGPMVEGKEYQLLCEVQNIAPVQYLTLRWYRDETEVYKHSFSDLTSSSPVQVSSILVITPTKAENGAQYKCVAELDLGPEGPQPTPTLASEPLNASVYFAPTLISPEPEVLDFTEGAEVTLNCTATGNPSPVYSWSPVMVDEAVITSSSLLPGTYTCTALNTLGKKSKQFTIKATTKGV